MKKKIQSCWLNVKWKKLITRVDSDNERPLTLKKVHSTCLALCNQSKGFVFGHFVSRNYTFLREMSSIEIRSTRISGQKCMWCFNKTDFDLFSIILSFWCNFFISNRVLWPSCIQPFTLHHLAPHWTQIDGR